MAARKKPAAEKARRINITMRPEIDDMAEKTADLSGVSKSAFISKLIADYCRAHPSDAKQFTPAEQARKVREYKRTSSRKK